jgi:hypothetical protein
LWFQVETEILESCSCLVDRNLPIKKRDNLDIVPLNHKRVFTIEDATGLLPVIYRITEVAHKEVRNLANRMEAIKSMSPGRASEIEREINETIDRWQQKVTKLGASPKGLWLADFDNGEGYYCWKFPETEISFWHGYNDGFSGRTLIRPEKDVQQ